MPDSVKEYLAKTQKLSNDLTELISANSELSKQAADNPSLINDKDWQQKIVLTLVGMGVASREMKSIRPVPEQTRTLNKKLRKLADKVYLTADEYSKGLTTGRASHLHAAARAMAEITPLANDAKDEVERINSHYE